MARQPRQSQPQSKRLVRRNASLTPGADTPPSEGAVAAELERLNALVRELRTENDRLARLAEFPQLAQKTLVELVERAPFGIYVVDSQFRIATMNAGSQNGAFRNVRPIIGRPFNEAMHILWPDAVAEEIIGRFRHTLDTGEPYYSARFVNPRHDAAIVESYEWELHRIVLPDGQHGVICYYFDSTTLRQVEDALQRSKAELSFALDLNDALRQIDDPLQIQETAARLLGERLQADRVFYGEIIVEDGVETLVLERDYHRTDRASLGGRFVFKEFSQTDYEDYRAGRTVASENVFTDQREPSQREAYRAVGVAAFIGVPFIRRGTLLGTLGVLHSQPRNWTPEEISLAEQTADRTWHAVERARAEKALRESEQRFRLVLAHSPITVATVDRELRYTWVYNPAGDVNADDVVGKALGFALLPDDRARLDTFVRSVLGTGESALLETTAQTSEGLRFYESHVEPLRDGHGTIVAAALASIDITDRKQAEEALRESEARLRLALAAARMVAWEYDPATRQLTITEDADDVLALPRGDVLKDSDRGYSLIHPDDVEKHRALVTGVIEKAGSYVSVYRQVRDGEIFWLEERGRALTDASGRTARLVGVTQNITARKQAEQALAAAKQKIDAHMDNSPLAVIEFDQEFKVTRWSREAERMFGWTAAEITGRAIAELRWVHEDDVETVGQVSADMLEGRRPRNVSVNRNYRKDGTIALCEWYNSAIYDADGRLTSILSQVLDITERSKAEAALRAANATLAEADRRKDEFIAILSHEMRNPLAPIRYALPLLSEERLGEGGRRAVAVVDRQVAHLTRLVDDLLDVSRVTTGKIELRPEHVTLSAVLSAAVEAASPAIAGAQHSLEVAVPSAPIWLNADAARISQAVTNLLNNSAKYTPNGGRIRLEATTTEAQVVIRVADNGVGIAAGELAAVFEMFRQGGGLRKSRGGLGIGLGLSKQLVEMHGGSIEGRSAGEGQGAEFVIRLPLAVPATRPEEQQPLISSGNRACLRVLVVDDNVDLVDLLAVVVEADGHQVRKAFDGRSAISAAREYQPHLILLDIGMPDMNGMEVAKALRQHPALGRTRIVALTGWGQAEDRRRTAEAGFDDHLTKPADPRQIQRILDDVAQRMVGAAGAD